MLRLRSAPPSKGDATAPVRMARNSGSPIGGASSESSRMTARMLAGNKRSARGPTASGPSTGSTALPCSAVWLVLTLVSNDRTQQRDRVRLQRTRSTEDTFFSCEHHCKSASSALPTRASNALPIIEETHSQNKRTSDERLKGSCETRSVMLPASSHSASRTKSHGSGCLVVVRTGARSGIVDEVFLRLSQRIVRNGRATASWKTISKIVRRNVGVAQ